MEKIGALLVLVVVATLISLQLVTGSGHIAALWLPNGLTLAFLLISPRRYWPAYLLAGFCAGSATSIASHYKPELAVCLAFANLVEIVIAASVVYRPDRPSHHFTDRESAVRMLGGFVVAPAISMIIAGVARYTLIATPFAQTVQVWYLAHSIGFAIVTPLMLTTLFKDFGPLIKRQAIVHTTSILLTLAIVTVFVFAQNKLPLLFCVFPFLALVVFQLGFPGMTVALFAIGVIVSFLTLNGTGPFMLVKDASDSSRIFMAQFYILTCVAMALPIAIALLERLRLEHNLRAAQEQLHKLAATDALTGIANRRMFDDFLDREWKRAMREKTSMCAIMIDVDCFKSYNDRYGHQAGDDCLRAIAAGLGEIVRRPGDLVARYGGEEFIVLLPATELAGAHFVAEKIRRRIEALQIVHSGASDARVTVSLGVEMGIPQNNNSPAEMIAAADALLYAAKHAGRNCVMVEGIAKPMREFMVATG